MKTFQAILFIIFLNACSPLTNYKEDGIVSPDSNLELSAFVNRTNTEKPNFARVVLTVSDKTTGQSTELLTQIGDAMKWAIGWYDNNTIVAQSSVIGTRCWRFTNGNFEKLIITPEMHEFAERLRIEKYHLDK